MDLRLNSTMPKAQNTLKPTFLTQKVEKYIPMATFCEPLKNMRLILDPCDSLSPPPAPLKPQPPL